MASSEMARRGRRRCGMAALGTAVILATLAFPAARGGDEPSRARLDQLFREASLWGVGTARERVEAAQRALVALGEPALRYCVERLATDDGLEMRAIEAVIRGSPMEAAVPALLGALEGPAEGRRRASAARLLGGLRAAEAVPALARALDDPEARVAALGALAEIGGPAAAEAWPRAAPLLDAADERTAIAAIGLARSLRPPGAAGTLVRQLDGRPATVRFVAEGALAALGAEAVPALLEALAGARPESPPGGAPPGAGQDGHGKHLRAHLLRALGGTRDPRAAPPLLQALDDGSFEARAAAAFGLGRLGGARALDAVRARLAKETHPIVRARLEEALAGAPAGGR